MTTVEIDEQWSKKQNQQGLWMVLHSDSRQVLAMHIGPRTKQSAESLLAKLSPVIKKSPLLHRYVPCVLRSTS